MNLLTNLMSYRKMNKIFFVLAFSLLSLNTVAQDIHRTACQGNLSRLDSLLSDTSINIKDDRGRSLLHWAVACQKKEVADFLVQKGIYLNAEDDQKETPLHVAVRFGKETYFDLLVKEQNNADWIQRYGASLLERAVLKKDVSFVKKLIANGIDINSRNDRGSTGLEISQRINAKEVSEFLLSNGADQNLVRFIEMKGKYMGQSEPGIIPTLFAPNFISTEESEFGSVFNSDGTEFYFGVDVHGKNEIRYSQLINNSWTKPEAILLHERYGCNDPFLSPDEDRLYFISNRALDGSGEPKDIDIWYVEKNEDGWSEPINTGRTINTDGNEYYISFTNEGTMYFSSDGHGEKEGEATAHDIYYSKFVDNEFQEPLKLGEHINTEYYEADVFISPDESYIIFTSVREDGFGRGDLYISFKNPEGNWTEAVNMGEKINSRNYEYCPFVTKDGKYLFYTSNQDIYFVSTEIFSELKSKSR